MQCPSMLVLSFLWAAACPQPVAFDEYGGPHPPYLTYLSNVEQASCASQLAALAAAATAILTLLYDS